MRVLDPLGETLYKNKRVVDGFRVAGVLVELAIRSSLRVSLTGLQPAGLPGRVSMRLDRLGEREVQAHAQDRQLAFRMSLISSSARL